ncbi:MAG: NADH-quinone oxidoreductase subunit M [Clostridiaceae bacterium]
MHPIAYIAVSFLVVPLIIILLVNLLPGKLAGRVCLYLAGASAVIQILSAAVEFFLLAAFRLHEYEFSLLWNMTKEGSERFSVTALSLVIIFCIGFVALVSVLIANQTVKKKKVFYVNLLMTLILGMNGMIIVTDLFSLYVFLEIVGLSSFVLIAMFQSETGLEGAFKYLVMSALASIFILTGLSFIFMQTGSLQYSQVSLSILNVQAGSGPILSYLAFILLIAGFAVKTGAVPFHSWLPDAHQSANTAVSVLLSGIVIKVAGIYGFIVLMELFQGVPAIKLTLAVMGTVSIIAGALLALRQDHFKRIVAYSSVSQMGYILLGVSTGSTLGLLGAVVHIFNHATFKSTLFSNAAALHEQTGTLDINEMGGLQSRMPVTGFSSIAAFLSTAGIPPFAGFWSKLLIIIALWNENSRSFAAIALFSSILTAAYFLRIQKKVFFGKLPDKYAELKEVGGSIRFAEIMLTVVMIVVGVGFPLALLYLKGRGIL